MLNLVGQHCERLAKSNVDGLMLSWSLGGYPSLNLELAKAISEQQTPNAAAAILALAKLHYGERAAPRVCSSWKKFSDAFTEYPYSGAVLYNAPQQLGPANLLYLKPTGYAASMVGIPYDDLNRWRGPYPPEVFANQFQKVADGWANGMADLEAAQAEIPDELKPAAAADLRVARAAQLHFASVSNQARFVMARDELSKALGGEVDHLCDNMIGLLNDEIDLARKLFELSAVDSRLGYEASNHYFYVPLDLVEKVINCEYLKQQLIAERAKQ